MKFVTMAKMDPPYVQPKCRISEVVGVERGQCIVGVVDSDIK